MIDFKYQVSVIVGIGETNGKSEESKNASEFCLDKINEVSSNGSKSLAKLLRQTLSRRIFGTGMKISL